MVDQPELDGLARPVRQGPPSKDKPAKDSGPATERTGPPVTQLSEVTPIRVFVAEMEQRLAPLTMHDLEIELEREIAMRVQHYPRFVEQNKLTRQRASLQLAKMRAALQVLMSLPKAVGRE